MSQSNAWKTSHEASNQTVSCQRKLPKLFYTTSRCHAIYDCWCRAYVNFLNASAKRIQFLSWWHKINNTNDKISWGVVHEPHSQNIFTCWSLLAINLELFCTKNFEIIKRIVRLDGFPYFADHISLQNAKLRAKLCATSRLSTRNVSHSILLSSQLFFGIVDTGGLQKKTPNSFITTSFNCYDWVKSSTTNAS